MAGAIAEAFVNVRANTSGFSGEVSRGITSAFRGIGRTLTGLAGAYGLGRLFESSIDSASDLAESMNAVQVSFQDLGSDAVSQLEAMGAAATTNMGLTQTEFNEAAVRFNAFSRSIAQASGRDVVSTLEDITMRATDFASVMNLDVVEAQRLFQSGLAGETEPLRRFGIDISAAAVETYALSEGIADTYQELTEAEKQMIRWQLILDQTSQMQGDFANTSHMLANAMRIAQAQIKEATMAFGEGLLPGLQTVVNDFNEFIPTIEDSLRDVGTAVGNSLQPLFDAIGPTVATLLTHMAPVIENIGRLIGALAPLMEPIIDVFGSLAVVVSDVLASAFVALTPVIETASFFLSAFADLIGSSEISQLIQQFSLALAGVGRVIADAMVQLLPIVIDLFRQLIPIIGPLIVAFTQLFGDVLAGILPVVTTLFEQLAPVILQIAEVFSGALLEALPELAEAFITIFEAIEPLIPILADGLLVVLEALEPILPQLIQGFIAFKIAFAALTAVMAANPIVLVVAALAGLAVGLKYAYDRFEPLRNAVDNLWQAMQSLWDVITNRVVSVWQDHLIPILREFEPLISGVKEAVGFLVEAFQALFSGDFSGALEGLKAAFQSIWEGLTDIDWARVGSLIVSSLSSAVSAAWSGLQSIGGFLGDVAGKFVDWFQSVDWSSVGNTIVNALALAAGAAWNTITSVASWFGDVIGKFTTWISGVDWGSIGQSLVNALALGASIAWNGITSLASWFGGIAGKFGAWISSIDWGSIGGSILNALALGVATAFQGIGNIGEWFGDLVGKLADWISGVNWDDVGRNIGDWVGELPGKLIGWISDAFSSSGDGGGGGSGANWTEVATTLLNGLGVALFNLGIKLPVAVGTALAQLAIGIFDSLGEKFIDVITGDNPVSNFFKELPGNFVDWIGDMAAEGFRIAQNFLLSIVQGLQRLRDRGGVGGFIAEIFGDALHLDQIEDAIRPGARQIRVAFDRAFADSSDGVNAHQIANQLFSDLYPYIEEQSGPAAADAFDEGLRRAMMDNVITADELSGLQQLAEDLLAEGEEGGENFASGFASGAGQFDIGVFSEQWKQKVSTAISKDVVPVIEEAPRTFDRKFSAKAPTALKDGGTKLIGGLKGGIDTQLRTVQTLMAGLSMQFLRWIGDMSRVLVSAGRVLILGLSVGIAQGLPTVASVLRSLARLVVGYVGSLANTLVPAGQQLMRGLSVGISSTYGVVVGTLRSVRSLLPWAMGDLSGVLYNSGRQLMQGFINGMRSQAVAISFTVAALTAAKRSLFSFHTGGIVPGGPNQEVLAVLQGGERVLTKEQQEQELGKAVAFGPGAIQVQFNGPAPSESQAYAVGRGIGRGIEDELNKSRIRGIARTSSV